MEGSKVPFLRASKRWAIKISPVSRYLIVMKKLLTFIFLTHALWLQSTPAFASELENTLKSQYGKHVLGLRSPIQGTHLKFDSTGKPLEQNPTGRWIVYGGIYVKKISLRPEKLELEGPWAGFGAHKEQDKPTVIPLGKSIKIEIQLDGPAKSIDDLQSLLDRVFFADNKDHQHTLPEFRRDDFVSTSEPVQKLVIKAGVVTAPVPISTPEPEFSERARNDKFQGSVLLEVVVDKAGTVSRLRIVRALGENLDLQAVEKVKTWRFRPAMRNGEPIAVAMDIEVSFNLY
jgi:TonB family protein